MILLNAFWFVYIYYGFFYGVQSMLATWEWKQHNNGLGHMLPFTVMIPYLYSMGGWFITTPFIDSKTYEFITEEDYFVLPLACVCVCFGAWLLYTANS